MVNQRFLLPAALVAIFFPRGALRGWRALLMAGAVAVMLILPPSLALVYRDFSRRAEPLISLIESTPLGSNTLVLHSPPGQRKFQDPMLAPEMTYWREMYNYPLVLRGGYDPYLYDDGFPIKRIRALPAPKVERAAEIIYSPSEQHFNPLSNPRSAFRKVLQAIDNVFKGFERRYMLRGANLQVSDQLRRY